MLADCRCVTTFGVIAPPLSTLLAGVPIQTPLVAAAGTAGTVDELGDVLDLRLLGAVTTKSITLEARDGNAPWRIIPARGGMLNAIGLANKGLPRFLEEEVPRVRAMPCKVFASVAGHCEADYAAVAAALDWTGEFPVIELNLSCPNTGTGRHFGTDAASVHSILAAVRPAVQRSKLFVKLAPDLSDPLATCAAAIDAGAQGLTLCNTMPALAIDVRTRRTRLSRGSGGLSGPAIHPIAVRVVHEVYRGVARDARVPIIGTGGVVHWEDAAELLLAGATAVGIGTLLFIDHRAVRRVVRGLDHWCRDQGAQSIGELVGAVQT
jgi:dihydroorotate dehydrogenase (NAD+) catalytic subunit